MAIFASWFTNFLHVCFGLPALLFPCGFQSKAYFAMLSIVFSKLNPIHPYLHFLISCSISVCWVIFPPDYCLNFFSAIENQVCDSIFTVNSWSLSVLLLVTLQVSAPYKRITFTFVLKMLIFVLDTVLLTARLALEY